MDLFTYLYNAFIYLFMQWNYLSIYALHSTPLHSTPLLYLYSGIIYLFMHLFIYTVL